MRGLSPNTRAFQESSPGAIAEGWPGEPPILFDSASCGRMSDIHGKHNPLTHSHQSQSSGAA